MLGPSTRSSGSIEEVMVVVVAVVVVSIVVT